MSELFESLLEQITEAEKCFRKACNQIIILNRQLSDLQVRYDFAMKEHARAMRYTLRVRIAVMEGIRNMYYAYASKKADHIVELRKEIQQEHERFELEDEDDSIYYDDEEYDLSDSELDYSDFDFSLYDDEDDNEVSELNVSAIAVNVSAQEQNGVIVGNVLQDSSDVTFDNTSQDSANLVDFTYEKHFEVRLETRKAEKETDLNETEISLDSGYLEDSIAEEENKEVS